MGLVHNFRQRLDHWVSEVAGIGVQGLDKRLSYTTSYIRRLPDQTLSALYHGDAIAHKICSCVVDEAMSRGYTISGPEPDVGDQWRLALEELEFWRELNKGLKQARCYGGGGLILGIDDGQQSDEAQALPLRMNTIRRVEWVKFVDRRRLDRLHYGDGDLYRVTPVRAQSKPQIVHKSRIIFLAGADTDEEVREMEGGWDLSVLQRVYDAIRDNNAAWASVSTRLQEASYTKLVIKDLAQMLASGNEAAVKDRAELLNYTRSVARTIIMDSEESYQRDTDAMQGVGDVLDKYQAYVAAVAGMPVTKLWGTSAKGMNATGEGDADDWSKVVQSYRSTDVQPALEAMMELVALSSDGPLRGTVPEQWSVSWPELEPMNDKERSEIYRATAEADAVYLDAQVLSPEEVALHRFKQTGYDASGDIAVDRDLLQESLEIGRNTDAEDTEADNLPEANRGEVPEGAA